ncbi:MAG: hypothetical protein IGQ88_07905 [Gloeomargaritaceae cyanobacterium C42_A2020_066]|nr:hypothetical protein [Gloeomargaritaceae cyanobacterium C42_A2020_066]
MGLGLSGLMFFPGCVDGDTLTSWLDGGRPWGEVHDWQPPFIAFLARFFRFWPFPPAISSFFWMTNLFYWSGVVLTIRRLRGRPALWLLGFVILGLFPSSFAILSQLFKDTMLATVLLLAYGLLVVAETEGRRWAWWSALVGLAFAIGFRHNAVFAVLPLLVWMIQIGRTRLAPKTFAHRCPDRWRQGLAVLLLLALVASPAGLVKRVSVAQSSYPIQQVWAFDLVGISVKANQVYLPDVYQDYQEPSRLKGFYQPKASDLNENPLTLDNLRKLYTPWSVNNVYIFGEGKGLKYLDEPQEVAALRNAWLSTLLHHPLYYLQVRFDLIRHWLGFPRIFEAQACLRAEDPMLDFTVPTNRQVPGFYRFLDRTVFGQGWFYSLVLVVASGLFWLQQQRWPDRCRYLTLSGGLYILSFGIFSGSSEFRFFYWIVVLCGLMGFEALVARTDTAGRG